MADPRTTEPDRHPMKVWPNRYPLDLIDRAKARAAAEGTDAANLLRVVLERALACPEPIIPAEVPADCTHQQTRTVGYTTVCCSCLAVVA